MDSRGSMDKQPFCLIQTTGEDLGHPVMQQSSKLMAVNLGQAVKPKQATPFKTLHKSQTTSLRNIRSFGRPG